MERAPPGFSLLETMVVVAILGVLAALAVPALIPEMHKARLDATSEGVAAFLARARAEAMTSRRCVRVAIVSPQKLEAHRLNAFDCDVNPASGPFIEPGTSSEWLLVDALTVDSARVGLSWDPAPAASGPSAHTGGEVRFRASGRLWSDTVGSSAVADVTQLDDDDAVLKVAHQDLAAAQGFKKILVQQQGLICALARGQQPTGTGNNLGCP